MDQNFQQTNYSDYVDFWLAVSKMETDNFTSVLFREYLNPWGMKFPSERQTTALPGPFVQQDQTENFMQMFSIGKVGKLPRWAKYKSLDDAAKDIVLWMQAVNFKTGIESLMEFVVEMGNHGYYGKESPESYYKKVVAMSKR